MGLCVCMCLYMGMVSLKLAVLGLYIREVWYISQLYITIYILPSALWSLKECRPLVWLCKVHLLMEYGVFKRFLEGRGLTVMSWQHTCNREVISAAITSNKELHFLKKTVSNVSEIVRLSPHGGSYFRWRSHHCICSCWTTFEAKIISSLGRKTVSR